MANLVIDIGNTQTKLAVFNAQKLLAFDHFDIVGDDIISGLVERYGVTRAIVSSVKKDEDWGQLLGNQIELRRFNYHMVTTVCNHYRTPHTLGADRLAAVAGAIATNPGNNNLVIDAGTCITYDYVDSSGNYSGGSISPGLSMRFNALNYYTAGLPLIEKDDTFDRSYGDDTESAIVSGVQNGIKYEVEGFVNSYRAYQQDLNIILTGGDGIFLDTLLKNSIFAPYIKNDPYLVLRGLNAVIQEHND